MSSVNLYDVLNLEFDSTKKEIKDAYKKLAIEFHPDKPTGNVEMFELITHAYEVLYNTESREQYDKLYKLNKQSSTSHQALKDNAKSYYKASSTDVTAKSKEESTFEFNKMFSEFDHKHNYKRGSSTEVGLTEEETKKRLFDLEMSREQEDIECIHDKLFDNGQFNISKFNSAFDKMHGGISSLVSHTGNPNAWNGPSASNLDSQFGLVDNYADLYVENDDSSDKNKNQNNNQSSVNFDKIYSNNKLSSKDIKNLDDANYTHGHNLNKGNFEKMISDKLQERTTDNDKYASQSISKFDTDPTCGGYGIFHELGFDQTSALEYTESENVQDRYKKLLDMRNTK